MDNDKPINQEAICKSCGLKLDTKNDSLSAGTELKPCPQCGSVSRQINLTFHDTISVSDDLSLVGTTLKKTGGKEVIYKGKYGTELHHDTNTLQERVRTFDFRKGTYYERIFNKATGFFKEINELISNHRGHGSSKDKTKGKA